MAREAFIFATGEYTMSAQISADVRALFADMGIEFEKTATGLVIDRFEQWTDAASRAVTSCGPTICNVELLEAA
jgi:hypothetical protein